MIQIIRTEEDMHPYQTQPSHRARRRFANGPVRQRCGRACVEDFPVHILHASPQKFEVCGWAGSERSISVNVTRKNEQLPVIPQRVFSTAVINTVQVSTQRSSECSAMLNFIVTKLQPISELLMKYQRVSSCAGVRFLSRHG